MDRMWLFTVLTDTVSSSAISAPLSSDGRSASTASSRSLKGAGICEWTVWSACVSCCANRAPTPGRRRRAQEFAGQARGQCEGTHDADGLAERERGGHRRPTRFRVVGVQRCLGLHEPHLDRGVRNQRRNGALRDRLNGGIGGFGLPVVHVCPSVHEQDLADLSHPPLEPLGGLGGGRGAAEGQDGGVLEHGQRGQHVGR